MVQISTAPLISVLDIRSVNGDAAAGTTDVNCTGVEMAGASGIIFVAAMGTITAAAVTSLIAEDSDDDSTYAAITGATVTIADDDDNKLAILDVRNVNKKKYIRCTVDRATQNAVVEQVIAIRYNLPASPATAHATVITPVSV